MLTVAILINGQPIMARSARRVQDNDDDTATYKCDTGEEILHRPDDGAVALAHKLLNTIVEE